MKFRKLPLQLRLEAIAADQGEAEAQRVLTAEFVATAMTPGFQALTDLLRSIETQTLEKMVAGTGNLDRLLGRLQCIHEIRGSLVALLPDDQKPKVDFHDDLEEEFVLIDPRARVDGKPNADD